VVLVTASFTLSSLIGFVTIPIIVEVITEVSELRVIVIGSGIKPVWLATISGVIIVAVGAITAETEPISITLVISITVITSVAIVISAAIEWRWWKVCGN
jgi:hypothetical protein